MVNKEIYGGLVSALSRGNSWYDAMMSLYNAGYLKNEIEEAAGFLKSQISQRNTGKSEIISNPLPKTIKSQESLKPAFNQKPTVNLKPISNIVPDSKNVSDEKIISPIKIRQTVSSYPAYSEKEIPLRNEIRPKEIKQNISSYNVSLVENTLQKKPIPSSSPTMQKQSYNTPQISSNYSAPSSKKKPTSMVFILFILLILLFGALISIFIFKDKIFEILGSLGF